MQSSNNDLILKIIFVILAFIFIGELFFIIQDKKKFTNPITPIPYKKFITNVTPSIDPNSNTDTTLLIDYKAKIIELNIFDIIPTPGAYNIELSIKLIVNEINEIRTLYFDKDGISHITVSNSLNNTISYKDLKKGDSIRVVMIYDELKKRHTDFKFIKLNE